MVSRGAPTLSSNRTPMSSIESQLAKPVGCDCGSVAAISLAAISVYLSGDLLRSCSIAATPLASKSDWKASRKAADSLSRSDGSEVFGLRGFMSFPSQVFAHGLYFRLTFLPSIQYTPHSQYNNAT